MDDKLQKAVEEISKRHREIINDWCKAYLAQLYEEGVDIKPGCFTLNEQYLDNVGGSVLGKKYWFEKGVPNYSSWVSYEDKRPNQEQNCWVCQHDNSITRAEYIEYHEIFGCGFGNSEEFIKEKYVKCWMPYFTPEPPSSNQT